MRERVLVTGGAGYVGSHACKALAAAGYEPVTFDDLRRGNRWAVRWGPLVEAPLEDGAALRAALRHFDVKAVLHFAAYATVSESLDEPSIYFRNNVWASQSLLDAMVDTGVKRLVLSSTCGVYGEPAAMPIGEASPRAPTSPYAASKAMLEDLARWYGVCHGIDWCALRFFNAAGADPDGEIGESHHPETHLIPIVIEAALGLRPHVQVNGVDYPTHDGTAVRDYVHVADLARAHVAALRRLDAGAGPLVANLGSGRGVSVLEIVAAVARAAGRRPDICKGPRRPGDAPELVADPRLAQETLGWRAEASDIAHIAETAVRWHRDHAPGREGAAPGSSRARRVLD